MCVAGTPALNRLASLANESFYWICFLNGEWIVYRRNNPVVACRNGKLALTVLRRLQKIEREEANG